MSISKLGFTIPTIFDADQRLDQTWFIQFYLPDKDNPSKKKRIRIYKGLNRIHDLKERSRRAKEIRDNIETQLRQGWRPEIHKKVVNGSLTWSAEIAHFLTETAATRSKKTLAKYRAETKRFLSWLQQGKFNQDIPSFTHGHAEHFRQHLISHKLSAKTVNAYIRTIGHIYDRASLRHDLTIINPFKRLAKFKATTAKKKRIHPEDLQRISAFLDQHDPMMMMFIRFVFLCFVRPYSELRFLKTAWINFEDETLTIPGNISLKTKKTLTVSIPKGKLLDQIQALKTIDRDLYVFTTNGKPGTKPIGAETIRWRFNQIKEALALDRSYTMYAFKHTGAAMLVKAGVGVKDIQLQMRHHSLEMTDQYLKSMIASESQAIKNLSFDL